MKTRLYSNEREAAGTMISGTCLVCDYQGVPHRIFCDVTTGKRPTGRHDTEHLRYRLEGVLAVTLTLGPGLPAGLCLKCEKGLCEIESRVRDFRDMHHATRERYRQMRVAGDAFICDLTRLETRHSEGGSETRRETETRHETETYFPQTSLSAVGCQAWQGSGPRHGSRGDGEVCQQVDLTPQSLPHTHGVQSTGMPVRSGPMPAEQRHSIGGIGQYSDNTMDTNSDLSQPPTHHSISACTDSTASAYGNTATKLNNVSREVNSRTEVNGNIPTHGSGQFIDRHLKDSSRPARNCNGIAGQSDGNRVLVNHRNGVSGEFKDNADNTYCRRLDAQCSVNGVNLRHDKQNGSYQEISEDNTYVNDCSAMVQASFAEGNGCYTDKLDTNCPCPVSDDQNHVKQAVYVGLQSEPENPPSAQTLIPEREDEDTNGLVLDLTVPRLLPERQCTEHDTRNVDDGVNNAADEPWLLSGASKYQTDYPLGNGQGGEWENGYHQEKQAVNSTSQPTWVCNKAPPPLIHVSQIKKEPIEDDPPFNKRHMSSLDYLQKMPFCIAPIEGGKGVEQEQCYDDSFLGEPPHKRYKHARGYSVPNQDSSFPVLNTHVSATLNVTHPGEDTDKNMTREKTPSSDYNPGDTVQTTTIQGTIRIPLNQLKNMKQGPANISLMTEATVNSTVVPSHQQESTDGQPQQSQHAAKIPVNMTVNTDELRARIPLHQVFLDQVQSAMPGPGVRQPPMTSQRVLNALNAHGLPVHHIDSGGHPMNPDPGNVSHRMKRMERPEWKHSEWPIQNVQHGNPQSNTNVHVPQPGLEVTGHRGQRHRGHGQGHIVSEKLGFHRQMTSYGWQHPRFSRAVVGHGQVQSQGQPIFPVPLQHPNMTPLQRHSHPPQPQGHSQPHQGQTEGQLHKGQTPRQDRKELFLSQHQGQEQPDQGQADKGYTRKEQASLGQGLHVVNLQGQVHDREQGHHNGGMAVEDHDDQSTKVKNTSRQDSAQTRTESEEEDDEEEDGKQVSADQDVSTGNLTSRNDGSGRRQLLRPWLEQRLNRGNIPGFQWVDKDRNLFKIPWKHRSKNDWSPDNCTIFMEWALHTGKHRMGVDKPDYCRWKTRLRCAFNQAADIQERKDLNKMKCSEPYKVYEFLSKSEIKPKPPPKPKPQVDLSKTQCPTATSILVPGVPSTEPHPVSSTHTHTGSAPHHGATYQPLKTMEIYTAVTGALMAVGGPLIRHNGGSPSSAPPSSGTHQQETRQTGTSSEQQSPNTTKMAAEPFPVEPVSVPVETNNNKFSWDADLDDERPLVIDLDRTDNADDGNMVEGRENESNRDNGQTQDGQFLHIHKQQMTRSRDGLYTCDLCGQGFTLRDTLVEHKDKIHGEDCAKSDSMCNGMVVSARSGLVEGNNRNVSRTSSYESRSSDSLGPIRDLDTERGSNQPITEGETTGRSAEIIRNM